MGQKCLSHTEIQTPDCPARSEQLYWLSYPGPPMIIINIILVIACMQGIYNYVPETNHVSREYTSSVAAILHLQFVLRVMLFGP